ncbi:hypothetical protein LCGC14_1700280 [marine sediment metagenome]|uniref:DUF7694 domain-containing protein n=1 Tax=marine sediment metagenome TaxID=412755 RepID=A0A0F9HIU0_9ZZZZ
MFHVPNEYRVRNGVFSSTEEDGNNGCFIIRQAGRGEDLRIIASDGMEWEHVSVSLDGRIPTWREMCHVKGLFWDDNDCVIQYHPAKSDYVNCHPFTLHLWRPIGQDIPQPPPILVGPKMKGGSRKKRILGNF